MLDRSPRQGIRLPHDTPADTALPTSLRSARRRLRVDPRVGSLAHGVLVAVAAVVAAGALRWMLTPWIGIRVPYATFFLAVVVAVRFAGVWPAVAVMLAGAVISAVLWFPSGPWSTETLVSTALYLVSASAIIWLGQRRLAAEALAVGRRVEADHTLDVLRESQRRLQLATEVSGTGVFEWDIAADRLHGDNPEAYRIFGRTPDLPKLSMAQLLAEHVHPDDRASLSHALRAGRDRREQMHTVFRCRRRDGEWRWLEVAGRYVYDDDGSARSLIGALADITERKQMEDELRGMAEDLSAADRRKNEFLATLAHELRNPLAPIRNGIEILRRGGGEAARVDAVVPVMERQMRHLVRLVDDLLDVSRITRGTLELRRQEVELAPVLRAAVEATRPAIDAHRHALEFEPPATPLHLDADPTRLVQVFANLLANAAKFTPDGGRIALVVEHDAGEVRITVRDNGAGIPAEMLPRVFDLFVQSGRAIDRDHGGLGIGLAMVRQLVELHGGRVAIDSAGSGHGTCVTVTLPRIEPRAPMAPSGPSPAAAPRALPAWRVLVVDDNRDAADSLAAMLSLLGSRVEVAYDGETALARVPELHPQVAFLDIGMPGMSGLELCRRLRALPGGERPVLVAVTGWGQDEDRRRSQEAGFDFHLTKPVDPAGVEALLARIEPGAMHPE
jgi:two-component system CheB/CheR fusion protein